MTYDVDDLLQSQAEFEHEGLRLVGDGSFQIVVLLHEIVNQSPLMRAAPHTWKKGKDLVAATKIAPVFKATSSRFLSVVLPFLCPSTLAPFADVI